MSGPCTSMCDNTINQACYTSTAGQAGAEVSQGKNYEAKRGLPIERAQSGRPARCFW